MKFCSEFEHYCLLMTTAPIGHYTQNFEPFTQTIVGKQSPTLNELPSAVWASILSYLSHTDMCSLMLLNQQIKRTVEPYLYMELTITEWASSGARLARAILNGIVSNETCACIRRLKVLFTSLDEISEALEILLDIQHRMTSIEVIEVEAHRTEDAYRAIYVLASQYRNCEMRASARAPPIIPPPPLNDFSGSPNYQAELGLHLNPRQGSICSNASSDELPSESYLGPIVLPLLSHLCLPLLYRREFSFLSSINYLKLDRVIEDGSGTQLRTKDVIQHLTLPYSAYVELGSPVAYNLELLLSSEIHDLFIHDPACTLLKLVATSDMPFIEPLIRTPSLKALILCNIAPLPSIKLIENNSLDTVEFISTAPVTIPVLQALASKRLLPQLKLLLVMVTRASFLTQTAPLRKREAKKLAEWLQVVASTYPVDIRDISRLLREDIYFSDGLWCLAAQTPYKKYLPFVVPPPLNNL